MKNKDELDIGIGILALIVSIISIVISIWGVNQSNDTLEQVTKYEIEQAHIAKIKIWDQEINIEVDSSKLIEDVLKIEYSNIGDGLAQDIKFEILPEEQKKIALQCEEQLESCFTFPYNMKSYYIDYLHSFYFDYSSDENCVSYSYDMFGDEIKDLESVDVFGNQVYFSSLFCDSKTYLLPMYEDDNGAFISLPKALSMLILNTLAVIDYNKEIQEQPITFRIMISYKDIYSNVLEDEAEIEISKIYNGGLDEHKDEDGKINNMRVQVIATQIEEKDTLLEP